ncbi:unnamed protein product, partial [Phaeothamnion confervicola]
RVRLRRPLPELCRLPEVYGAGGYVGYACAEALLRLRQLAQAATVAEAAMHGLFPEAAQVLDLESRYGESISLEDMFGPAAAADAATASAASAAATAKTAAGDTAGHVATDLGETVRVTWADENCAAECNGTGPANAARKADTDSANAAFEAHLLARAPRDMLAERRREAATAAVAAAVWRQRRLAALAAETVPTTWCYATQKLNYVEAKKAQMREKLAKDHHATYTYNPEFLAATVAMVDEQRIRQDAEAEARRTWMTRRGFVWPAPRWPAEYNVHPRKPSQSRVDELQEPWVENALFGGGGGGGGCGGGGGGFISNGDGYSGDFSGGGYGALEERPEFDTVTTNGTGLFGGLAAPCYERAFDGLRVGDRRRLPRGRQVLEPDPLWTRSIHLVGEGLAAERVAAKKAEWDAWAARVVVDDVAFRVGGFAAAAPSARLAQTDRYTDLLHGRPKTLALRHARTRILPESGGGTAGLEPAPVSIFVQEPYAEPRDFTADLRADDPASFAGRDPDTGRPVGFVTRVHRDRLKPRLHVVLSKRPIPLLLADEMTGPKWQ